MTYWGLKNEMKTRLQAESDKHTATRPGADGLEVYSSRMTNDRLRPTGLFQLQQQTALVWISEEFSYTAIHTIFYYERNYQLLTKDSPLQFQCTLIIGSCLNAVSTCRVCRVPALQK
jgi:hypothetical protein